MIARIPRTRKNFVLLCVVWAFTILALLLQHADAKEDEGDPSCINQEQFVHPAENPHLDVNGDDDDDDSDDEDEDEEEGEEEVETGFEHDPWNSVAQEVEGPERVATHEILKQTQIYMTTEVSKTEYDDVRDKCLLQYRLCSFWAAIGECQDSSKHMALNCAPTCQTCHLLRYDPAEIGEVSSPVKGFNDYIINQVWRHMSDVSFSLKKPVPKPEPPRRSGIGHHKEKRRRRDRRTLA
jgi:hypothetical protein